MNAVVSHPTLALHSVPYVLGWLEEGREGKSELDAQ